MDEQQSKLRNWFEHEQRQPRQSIVQALDSLGLKNGDRVADVGCGPGVHLGHISERVAPDGEVVGIDTNPERLAVANAMLQDQIESGSVRLVEGDLHALDSELGPFDLIWMSLVLHHEAIPVEVIHGLRNNVVAGGRIAILDGDESGSFPLLPWPPDFEQTIRQAVMRASEDSGDGMRTFGRRYTARSLPAILQDAGLSNVQIRAYSDVRQEPLDEWDRNDIAEWLRGGFGNRIRDYLAPADWAHFVALLTTGAQECILNKPGFFMARTWYLGVGTSD
jgi:ubiquinone/menaquinone biosynthesis C-methylase UbiE